MLEIGEYLALRASPKSRAVMVQSWRDLLFLHFSMDPAKVQALLPNGLTVDTFADRNGVESAWIGLVAFHMSGIRLRGLPKVPGTHAFPETNVRTYVHRDGHAPGVWFFSLEAANALACAIARSFWRLPYHWAAMSVARSESDLAYRARRRSDASQCDLDGVLGDPLGPAVEGTLEFFLIERYLLYASSRGRLWQGQVHHRPYELRRASVAACSEGLIRAAGIETQPWEHVVFSPGVDVEVFPLELAAAAMNRR